MKDCLYVLRHGSCAEACRRNGTECYKSCDKESLWSEYWCDIIGIIVGIAAIFYICLFWE